MSSTLDKFEFPLSNSKFGKCPVLIIKYDPATKYYIASWEDNKVGIVYAECSDKILEYAVEALLNTSGLQNTIQYDDED